MVINRNINEYDRQNKLLKYYINKNMSSSKIKELIEIFIFSQLYKLFDEMDIEFFTVCYFLKYFDHKLGQFHKELF